LVLFNKLSFVQLDQKAFENCLNNQQSQALEKNDRHLMLFSDPCHYDSELFLVVFGICHLGTINCIFEFRSRLFVVVIVDF